MAGREGEIMLGFNQKFDGHTEMLQLIIIGADPGGEGFEHTVADQQAHHQRCAHSKSDFAGLGEEQQNHRNGDPEDAGIAQQSDNRHHRIQEGTPQISGDPIQNGQIKILCEEAENIHQASS